MIMRERVAANGVGSILGSFARFLDALSWARGGWRKSFQGSRLRSVAGA